MARVHGSPKMMPVFTGRERFTARERAVAELFENTAESYEMTNKCYSSIC